MLSRIFSGFGNMLKRQRAASRTVRWSGGPGYHRHARRMRESFWRPFRIEIEGWLSEWHPRAQTLVLVGPSGGYCLPDSFLLRFEKIIAFDLDPEAEARFRTLHRAACSGSRLEWRQTDALSLLSEGREPSALETLLTAARVSHAETCPPAVLFCNLLGQVRFRWEDPEEEPGFAAWCSSFGKLLAELPEWASFHDRFSGGLRPRFSRQDLEASPALEHGWARFLADSVVQVSGDPELLDHLTDHFVPCELPRTLCRWEFAPGVFHWIECVRSGA